MNKILVFILSLLCSTQLHAAKAPWVGSDLNGGQCNGNAQGYGPFDYTLPAERRNMPVVEEHHFTPNVQNLIRGQSDTIPGDLDYTLHAIPNHHKALLSAIRYQLRINQKLAKSDPRPLLTPIECYLQRAIHFSPRDAASVSLLAYYMKEIGQLQKALALYEQALQIRPDPKIEYSYSLLLIDLKQYDKALEYAQKAYKTGKPPQGLKNKLVKLGVWK